MDTKGSELTEIMKEQEQETAPSKDGDVGVRSIQFVRIEHDQERDGDSVEDDMTVDHDGSSHASSDGTNNHISGTMGGVDHRRLRKCLINSFIMVIITVPVLIYLAARSAQTDAFENDYKSLSEQVVDAFESNVGSLLIGLDSVGVLATSHALDSNSTWPFVTLYDFDYVGASALALTDTPGISLNPFVKPDQREAWERYSLENIGWLLQALARAPAPPTSESARSLAEQAARNLLSAPDFSLGFSQQIYEIVPNVENPVIVDDSDGPYLPSWQSVPVDPVMINFNLNSNVVEREQIRHTFASAHALISPTENLTLYDPIIADHRVARYTRWLQQLTGDLNRTYAGEPVSSVFYPVFDTFDKNREVVAILSSNVLWERFFTGILPPSSKGVVCVVENSCGGIFTYRFDGESTEFLGLEDHHDTKYDEYEVVYELASARQESEKFKFSQTVPPLDEDFCPFSLRIYPSADLQDEHMTPAPVITTICVAVFLLFLGFVANSYDWMVRRRTRRILKSEKQAHAVVASHFPHLVRDRLFTSNRKTNRAPMMAHPRARIKNYLDTSPGEGANKKDDISFLHEAPIADLFLHCTVLFADISGFSPWSSEREPEQVFTLLETIFQAFDRLAKKHGVFKVETIGDSYVAVTGLPEPQSDHALRMTRFARDALTRANKVTRFLETALGPGTADLQFRFGLHSGQVTAGVLMGEKTRFQLFGDTVNTASRMESTGQGNRIQISESTALLLFDGGKEDWIQLRSDPVNVKGKGVVKTYWAIHRVSDDMLQSRASVVSISRSDSTILDEEDDIATGFTDEKDLWAAKDGEGGQIAMPKASKVSKNQRLVSWLKDLMTIYLKKVVAQRQSRALLKFRLATADPESKLQKGEMVLDEVVDAFIMPKFDWKKNNRAVDPESIELPPEVTSQLHDFIEAISSQYRDNPFHNFEHASHVTMSAVKLLNRIVVPEDIDYGTDNALSELHDYTYGITSDALAQFAVAFSTLIHDVDHRGVPNGQLAQEIPQLGDRYKNTSVAEQNSVDLAWNLLMEPQFKDLQGCIFTDEAEVTRFRKYVVNLVIATDIFEKQMKQRRQERWTKAFAYENRTESSDTVTVTSVWTRQQEDEAANMKATIVLEHIIQAADVSHTMQHWKVYKKWNEKLFQEMYAAYETGRTEKDPSLGWYGGEIWFFDNYVIPLARKVEECGVFGVSSDECLNYAVLNRKEWEEKGKDIVKEMVERYHKRKNLEVGGFTPEEINAFTAKELEHLLKQLIKKGRAFGTFKGCDKHGQRNAAQAWLDALEIHERCPESARLKDQSFFFPVYSGLVVFMKGGKILQDADCTFEQNLAAKYVRDTERAGDPVHYSRALAMLCEVQAHAGKYREALETFSEVKRVYDPVKHSEGICQAYGTDRTVHSFSQSALWYHMLGDTENSVKACDYVLENILHLMDPSNILNSCELLLPVIRIMAYRGQVKQMRDLFDDMVVQNYHKFEIKFTPARPIFKPLIMLLDIWHDPDNYPEFSEAVEWLLEEGSAAMDNFFDNMYVKLGWGPNTVTADLCLRFAKKLHGDGGEIEKVQKLVKKGIDAARNVEWKMKDDEGNVKLPVAYEIHEPVSEELMAFASELGMDSDLDAGSLFGPKPDHATLQTSFGLVRLSA